MTQFSENWSKILICLYANTITCACLLAFGSLEFFVEIMTVIFEGSHFGGLKRASFRANSKYVEAGWRYK